MHPSHKTTCRVPHQLKSIRITSGLILPATDKAYRSGFFETRFHIEDSLQYLLLYDTCCSNQGQHVCGDYYPVVKLFGL